MAALDPDQDKTAINTLNAFVNAIMVELWREKRLELGIVLPSDL